VALSLTSGVSGAAGRPPRGLPLEFESPSLDDALGPPATDYADISWLSRFPGEREVLIFPSGDCMGDKRVASITRGPRDRLRVQVRIQRRLVTLPSEMPWP